MKRAPIASLALGLGLLATSAASCSGGAGQGGTGGIAGAGGLAGSGTGGVDAGAAGAGGQTCGPDGGVVVDDGPPPPNAAVTAVGTPTAPPSTAVIGPAGGTVTSSDQKLQVTIPPGALCADTTIGITNITNMAPGGVGSAYRLTPAGQVVALPMTLKFTPGDELETDPTALPLAFQRLGVWQITPQIAGTGTYDPTTGANTLTFQATTTRFVDYAWAAIMVVSGPSQVVVGQSINLETQEYELASSGNLYLAGTTQPYPGPAYVNSWSINGMPSGTADITSPYGYIVNGYGPDAVYTAPGQLPSSGNPVTITVMVPFSSSDYWLHKHIQLLPNQ